MGEPFRPVFLTCDRHGQWQGNIIDEAGMERWRSNCPACVAEHRSSTGRASIPPRWSGLRWSSWQIDHEGHQRAVEAIKARVSAIIARDVLVPSTIIQGPPGVGKTHLMAVACNETLAAGRTAAYYTLGDITRAYRATWGKGSERSERSEADVIADLIQPDLLVIDDVGAERITESVGSILYAVVDGRYAWSSRPLMMATNLTGPQFGQAVGARVADRLRAGGGKMIGMIWESRR
jgi:DNA replication protein DnaC